MKKSKLNLFESIYISLTNKKMHLCFAKQLFSKINAGKCSYCLEHFHMTVTIVTLQWPIRRRYTVHCKIWRMTGLNIDSITWHSYTILLLYFVKVIMDFLCLIKKQRQFNWHVKKMLANTSGWVFRAQPFCYGI